MGRSRFLVAPQGGTATLSVAFGFGTTAWLGSLDTAAPPLGNLAGRSKALLDDRGRVLLDRRVRAWLAVEDPSAFDVVLVPAESGGVHLIPVEGFARRWEAVSDDERRAG